MEMVAVVSLLALIQYIIQGVRVGQARGRYGVEAPAIAGHPVFERHFRVHQNTLEQLVVFLPALWLCAWYTSTKLAVILGFGFIVARFVYERGYIDDPKKRSTGAALTAGVTIVLLLAGLIGALIKLL